MTTSSPSHVLVTGGAGYVGSVLVPELLAAGHRVTVLDLFLFGHDVFPGLDSHPGLRLIEGDIRHPETVAQALAGCDTVIHLACISNDPSFELNPTLGREINHTCFLPLVEAARAAGVGRFIYASSSSVYGIKEGVEVTEDLPLEPLTDYSRFKALCEEELMAARRPGFVASVIRPATVCGYAPRQRLDVIVNILTNHAVNNRRIRVFGGSQLRPNIHIRDMARAYLHLLAQPPEKIDGGIWNVGYENHSLMELAEAVRAEVDPALPIDVEPTDDLRSYHVSSARIARDLGFTANHTIRQAVAELAAALKDGRLPDALNDARYFNVKRVLAWCEEAPPMVDA
ncbi:NAD-dependent epimerase/dehydratase family protein [Roseospirillum parvum]|uniref:Nucleoside-diphosphate-sugar epimerase n=1 Tax=Roseospirillum parvum TaxID=83401 RepID=A0A1G7TUM8_9PROT|nr:SDR family oxidoreductase [Roseospirillum parvum]SDG39007.1 Nucleoside-diphosphate-sugar epimerase [Roseospirillum parvum]